MEYLLLAKDLYTTPCIFKIQSLVDLLLQNPHYALFRGFLVPNHSRSLLETTRSVILQRLLVRDMGR